MSADRVTRFRGRASARLRPYRPEDLEETIALWLRAWTVTFPDIDFRKRLDWWRARWLNELLPVGEAVVAEDRKKRVVGFVVITPATGYLDQIVVGPELWGTGLAEKLLEYAKRRCPSGVELHVNQSNQRAIRFYEREGFRVTAEDVNPRSGLPILKMRWE